LPLLTNIEVFLLQGISYYSALLFTAFLKHRTFGCVDPNGEQNDNLTSGKIASHLSCLPELENLLVMIFCWRLLLNGLSIFLSLLMRLYHWSRMDKESKLLKQYDIEYELSLDIYENTYENYAGIVIQVL